MHPPVIVPTPLLGQVPHTRLHLCYTSIAKEDSHYRDFYRQRSLEGGIVILDHSPEIPRKVLQWYEISPVLQYIQPRAVVLPNLDYETENTIRLSRQWVKELKGTPVRKIGCLQGATTDQLDHCYREIVDLSDAIGLPCSLEKVLSRNKIIEELHISKPVVFIETYKDFIGERPQHPNADLYWSSLPYRLGLVGKTLSSIYKSPPSLDLDRKSTRRALVV